MNNKEDMRPIPPIRREIWLLLKKYALEQTRETGRQITLSEVIEKAILNLVDVSIKKS